MNKISRAFFIVCGLVACVSNGDVVNGSVDDPTIEESAIITVANHLDQGWFANSSSSYDLSFNDIYTDSSAILMSENWFGQFYTDNYFLSGNGVLSFDLTWLALSRGVTADFNFEIYGTDTTGSSTAMYLDVNNNAANSGLTLLDSGSAALTSTGNYEVDLDLGETSYNFIGVRFQMSATGTGAVSVDNISVIPEPAVFTLIGTSGLTLLLVNRVRRRTVV